ncbi:TonB-dependent receptor domain-containing protein [Ferruginibacter sp.]|uniref:TonB-dependent receptor domain-containing protein n=2 Tax=Ferruginibacter sp. TaxID=1940288 RepID=UPI00374D70A4
MMPKLLLSVLFTIYSVCNLYAQLSSINGHISNAAGKSPGGTTILLYRFTDSLLIKTAIADDKGDYEINQVSAGKYFIRCSFSGYTKISTSFFSVGENEIVTAPALVLLIENKRLQDVTVTDNYKKNIIEVTAGKTVFNVENSINATGSTAFELLQKSPGVLTDKDDNISLRGKNGVRVYIDGRAVPMDAAELAGYLKSIPSSDIESIEMISNPSAKYDASGNAGIINIKLKKNNTIGFNGSASAGLNVGINPKTNASLGLNYRNSKVNIFGSYNNNWSNNDNTFNLYRLQNDTIYDQKNLQNITGWSHNIKAGADFFASKKSTLGIIFTGNFSNNTVFSQSRTPSISAKTGITDRILYATNTIPGVTENVNFNVNYRYADTTGHEINIDVDHGFYNSRKSSYQPNQYYTPVPETLLYEKNYRNNTPINITINTQKIDYAMPYKKGQLSAGVKFSFVKTNNVFNLYNVINNQDYIDLNQSNTFFFNENVLAGYINYTIPLNKKLNLSAGVRVENTSSKSLLIRADGMRQTDEQTNRNYTDLFPSAGLSFIPNEKNSFSFNYSRRIDRPNYNDLNPFESRVDELTSIKGNAFLKPQYSNSFQLTHTYKSRFTTTIGYSQVKDFSTFIIDTTEKTRVFITKKNLASQNIASINFSLPFKITKWWDAYTSVDLYNSKYNANFGNAKIVNINVTTFGLYARQTFKMGNGFSGEISGYYTSPSVSAGTFKTRFYFNMDIGIQKKLNHDKASVKFSYTDLFHTLQWNAESNYGGTHILAHSHWESQQFRMNFTYRFGSNKIKEDRGHATGNEDEKKRTSSNGLLDAN